ncbi:MAG: EF-hand domain-containing protein [Verrucomicrobiia bacterium]
MNWISLTVSAALVLGQMTDNQVEQAADGIATAIESETPTGQVIQSVPQPFTVPGQAKPTEAKTGTSTFHQADKDQDGTMSYEEFARIIKEEKFKAYDTDGDGFLSQEEAQAAAQKIAEQQQSGEATRKLISIPFSEIDTNGDSRLSREEVLQAVKRQPQVQTIFNGIGAPRPEDVGRPAGVSLDEWNNYETVGGGVPLLRFSF